MATSQGSSVSIEEETGVRGENQGNFKQITDRSRKRTPVIVVRDTHVTNVPPVEVIRSVERLSRWK